jgi:cytochrome c oxidase subunit II
MKKLFAIGMTLILGVGLTLNAYAAGDATKGKAAYAVCAACHGANGMGNKVLNAPRISGQEPWYLERQLKNFKAGIRGANSKDPYGMQMRPMALTLANDQAVSDMAAYVSSMPDSKPSEITVKGDATAGKASYMICQTCHGPKGDGNKALNSPKLTGLQDWYIVRQLKNFKSGIRGTKNGDLYGMQMRPMALTLANDEAINNVAAYIATFK